MLAKKDAIHKEVEAEKYQPGNRQYEMEFHWKKNILENQLALSQQGRICQVQVKHKAIDMLVR